MFRGLRIFTFSLLASISFKIIEVYLGIENGFHPDSLYYVDNYYLFTLNGFLSLGTFNNLYYFIVEWLSANEIALIFLNQIAFAITNILIARQFDYNFKTSTLIKIFILFLPYRLHLSAHVLKDTLIILSIFATISLPVAKLPVALILTSLMRIVAGPATLLVRFFPTGRVYFIGFIFVFIGAVALSPALFEVLSDRGNVDMIGRDYFAVPLSNTTSINLIFIKSLLWPILAKTGGYIVFAISPIVFVLALEPIIFLGWTYYERSVTRYLTSNGTLVMILFSVLVTNYGAYYRYIYGFMILDYVMIISTLANFQKPKKKAVRTKKRYFSLQ